MKKNLLLILIVSFGTSCKKEGRVIDGDYEPPAPYFWEDYDDESVKGVDADDDGLRDDLERKINDLVDTPNRRKAFKQYYGAMYTLLQQAVYIEGLKKSKQMYKKTFFDRSCVWWFYNVNMPGVQDKVFELFDEVDTLLKDSSERERVYYTFDKNLAGGLYTLQPANIKNCKFKISE